MYLYIYLYVFTHICINTLCKTNWTKEISTPTHTILLLNIDTKLLGLECELDWPY